MPKGNVSIERSYVSDEKKYEKMMAYSENFMNDLVDIAKNFEPICDENGNKLVYFEVEEKDGVVNKCKFVDKRKDDTVPQKKIRYSDYLAEVEFLRIPCEEGYFFSLSTRGPLLKIEDRNKKCGYRVTTPHDTRSTSTTGYHRDPDVLLDTIKEHIGLPTRLEKIIGTRSKDDLFNVISGDGNNEKK